MKPLKEEILFQDTRDHLLVEWRHFCELENEVARKLLATPGGPTVLAAGSGEAHAIVVGDIAWVLVEEVEWVALYSGNYDRASNTVTDLTTRHDVGLGWVDYDQDVLAQGQELLRAALSADVGPVSVTVVADNGA